MGSQAAFASLFSLPNQCIAQRWLGLKRVPSTALSRDDRYCQQGSIFCCRGNCWIRCWRIRSHLKCAAFVQDSV